jgi:hypothetical protein
VPGDALVAACGRLDLSAAIETIAGFMTPEARQAAKAAVGRDIAPAFGKQAMPAVIDAIGPDWGLWLTPPASAEAPLPELVAAVRIRHSDDPRHEVTKAVSGALNLAASAMRFMYNAGHADQLTLEAETRDGVEVRHFAGDKAFPPGVRPAFGLKGGYLVITSSPEAVFRFAPPPLPAVGAAPAETPMLRVSAPAVRAYLARHEGPLSKLLAELGGKPAAEARQFLQFVAGNLAPFDRLEVTSNAPKDVLTVRVRLHFTK